MSREVNVSVSVNVPDELYEQARSIAEVQRVSVEEVVASALADHFVAWRRLRKRLLGAMTPHPCDAGIVPKRTARRTASIRAFCKRTAALL
jgi:hypothetical protein